jgi:hypothetical protein
MESARTMSAREEELCCGLPPVTTVCISCALLSITSMQAHRDRRLTMGPLLRLA